MEYKQYLTNDVCVTIPATVHHLPYHLVQASVFVWHPATGRYSRMPAVVTACTWHPQDASITVSFAEPVTGVLFVHEHPDARLARAADGLRATFEHPRLG